MRILDSISGHHDLAALDDTQRDQLCTEIRGFLIDSVSKTGGHLASNLGVVELTVAIETVFNSAKDSLVFDVGHQSYVHKMLTGRQADFASLRQFGGIAGFPKPSESESDAFVAGHASSSVSISLGMARARTLRKEEYHIITLLGDGAATGGMVYEGLNDAAQSNEPMIVILNDNAMSIDQNVGGMAYHLSRLRTKSRYLGLKRRVRGVLRRLPGGNWMYRCIHKFKNWLRRALIPTTIFENMGFTYLGPVDGHDVRNLIDLLRIAKDMNGPVLLHVITQKGRGYAPAQEHPKLFHGIGIFDPATGEPISKGGSSFSDAFGDAMISLAKENPALCAITAAMPGGTGLLNFKKTYPDRLFDVGIAEEHAVSMAGGLAKQGAMPVVAIYSTFLQRAFDMILQDVCMLNLHVIFAIDRAGLVGEDGETHHGLFDIGFLRQAPGLQILCPASCKELQQMLSWAVDAQGPIAIRYPRGTDRSYSDSDWMDDNRVCCHRCGKDAVLITYGAFLENVMQAAEILEQNGVSVTVLRLLAVNPLPLQNILPYVDNQDKIAIIEETLNATGIGADLAESLKRYFPNCKTTLINLGDGYITHGNMRSLYRLCGIDGEGIAAKVQEAFDFEG